MNGSGFGLLRPIAITRSGVCVPTACTQPTADEPLANVTAWAIAIASRQCVAAASASPAVASLPGTGTRNTPKTSLPRGDRKFIEEAAASGMFEQQAAQLAATKATDPR
mgnify:CR=1 FL=1